MASGWQLVINDQCPGLHTQHPRVPSPRVPRTFQSRDLYGPTRRYNVMSGNPRLPFSPRSCSLCDRAHTLACGAPRAEGRSSAPHGGASFDAAQRALRDQLTEADGQVREAGGQPWIFQGSAADLQSRLACAVIKIKGHFQFGGPHLKNAFSLGVPTVFLTDWEGGY